MGWSLPAIHWKLKLALIFFRRVEMLLMPLSLPLLSLTWQSLPCAA
jgi:hypothetical protein